MQQLLDDPRITALLNKLENAIDPETELALERDWLRFLFEDSPEPIFSPQRRVHSAAQPPEVSLNDTLPDTAEGYCQMLLQQYGACLQALSGNQLLCVRPNYGVGILPSLFGAELFVMERRYNQLPNVLSLGKDALTQALAQGRPSLEAGLGGRVWRVGGLFAEIACRYPRIGRFVHPVHPDLQGPLDAAELLCGSALFYDLYDAPDQVQALLTLLTDTYCACLDRWQQLFPYNGRTSAHWGMLLRGAVMLREDSAMNLSPALFDAFARPHDERILRKYGGCVHFCGRGDHFVESLCGQEGITAINMSQPELNEMETIYRATVDRGLRILGFPAAFASAAKERGVHGRLHCA